MNEQVNEHIFSVSGKASSPSPFNMAEEYKVTLIGDIRTISKTTNDDGTVNLVYKFKPSHIESVEGKGKTTLKDQTTLGQRLRGRSFIWATVNESDKGYDWFARKCIQHFDEVMNLLIELE